MLCLAAVLGLAYFGGGGPGGRHPGTRATTSGRWPNASVGHGIRVSYPPGWHLFTPPITSVAYPLDRLLLTSYPARTGGNCSPTRAENALPANGVLIWLFEYGPTAGTVSTSPHASEFATKPRAFTLPTGDLATYECWLVPSYLERFRAAGRFFQVHIAFGPDVTAPYRSQALRILDSLRVQVGPKSASR